MRILAPYSILVLLLGTSPFNFLIAQDKVNGQDQNPNNHVTGGFHLKPFLPMTLIGERTTIFYDEIPTFSVTLRSGYSAGGMVRRTFTKLLSIESGIDFTTRNFTLAVSDTNALVTNIDFRFISFGLPIKGLISVQLSKKLFSTFSFGLHTEIYPSSIVLSDGDKYSVGGLRNSFIGGSGSLGLGLEYRTKSSGWLYFGANAFAPFKTIFYNEITWDKAGRRIQKGTNVLGSWMALDFRYYLSPTPILKEKKKSKKAKPKS